MKLNFLKPTTLFALLSFAPGCMQHSSKPEPDLFVACIDISGSTIPMRGAQLSQLDTIANWATISGAPLELWTFDKKPLQVWGPRVPVGSASIAAIKAKTLSTAGKVHHITRPALLLSTLLNDPGFKRSHRPIIVLLTDGDSEVPSDSKLFLHSAAALAATRHLQFAILDISAQNRSTWQKAFSACPASHFHEAGITEAEAELASLLH